MSKYDEIRSISIDAPGGLRRMVADRSLVGWISLDDSVVGKLKLEVRDPMAMAVAVEALPRRLGERVKVNVELDDKDAVRAQAWVKKPGSAAKGPRTLSRLGLSLPCQPGA